MPKVRGKRAYCVKCKVKRLVSGGHVVTVKGHKMLKGTCKKCGTKIARFVKA